MGNITLLNRCPFIIYQLQKTKEKQRLNTYDIPFPSHIQTAEQPRIRLRQQEIATGLSSELMGGFQIPRALNPIALSLERLSLTTSVLCGCQLHHVI